MTSETIIPEDVKDMILDILANEEKEEEVKEETELDRIYIEDLIPEIPENEPKKEAWKIEINYTL